MINIDKNIPLTPRKTTGRDFKYPWREMEVGDSFFIEGKTVRQMASNAVQAGKDYNRKFANRTVEGGVRVWRIE